MAPRFRSPPCLLLLVLVFLTGTVGIPIGRATGAEPDTPPPPAMNSADTRQLIDILRDPARRSALIATLESLEKAAPASTQPSTAEAGAAKPAPREAQVGLQPDSLGAQLMSNGKRFADTVSTSLLLAVRGVADVPDLLSWARGMAQNPALLLTGAISAGRLLAVLLLALGGELLVWRLTRRFYKSLAADAHRQDTIQVERTAAEAAPAVPAAAPAPPSLSLMRGWLLLVRLPIILMALTVDILPPLAFLAVATVASATPLAETETVRAAILGVVNAYVIVRILRAVARATFGAPTSRLRLLPVSDDAARYLMAWVRRIGLVIVAGSAISPFASFFGMDNESRQGVLRLVSLIVHVMLIVMVLQCRTSVAARLSGAGEGFLATLRHRLASAWHVYAIIFIIAGWIISVSEVRDGLDKLIRFMLWTIVVALAARVADIVLVGALDRGFSVAHNGSARFVRIEERVSHYHAPLRVLIRVTISVVSALLLLQVWGIDALGWFTEGALGGRLAGSILTLILTFGLAVALWEAINVALQVYLDRLSREGAAVRAARLRTIVPLLRNTLLIILLVLIVLTAMSELGVNIGPLLAGASIFGVAIGFGSQKLVQDFITGIFLLVENAMQVGDFVTAGGLSGKVETLSIRTLKLRASDGSVHLIPYSSVSTVTNVNRGLGNASVTVTVDYQEDSERVAAVLKQIVTDMRADQAYANGMLSDLQLWGVDRVDGQTMTIAGQIECTDGARWSVQREFNRRVKNAFQTEGIRMMPQNVNVTSLRETLDVRMKRPDRAKPEVEATAESRC